MIGVQSALRTVSLSIFSSALMAGTVSALPDLVDVIDPGLPAAVTDKVIVSALYEQSDRLVFLELQNISTAAVDVSGWQIVFKVQGNSIETAVPFPSQGFMLADSYVAFVDSSVVGLGAFSFDGTSLGLTATNKLEYIRLVDAELNMKHTTIVDSTVTGFTTKWWSRESTGFSGYFSLDFTGHTSDAIIRHTPLYQKPTAEESFRIVEVYSRSKDCSPLDESWWCYDYIKLFIPESQVGVDAFVLRTDSSSSESTVANTFSLPSGQEGYVTIRVRDDGLPMEINSSGYVWLEDMTGTAHGLAVHYSAGEAEQGASWALGSDGTTWLWSTTPTPSGANVITLPVEIVVTCSAGKYLNPETGRCRTIEEAVNELAACPEGQYRNATTNRCRQLVATASATLASCGEGQERNPLTNRCRSIASAVAELIPCDEGYERNPATNRCRKVTGATLAAAAGGGGIEGGTAEQQNPYSMWGWALAGIAGTGAVGYGVYEWRHEITNGWKSLKSRVGRK